MKQEYVVNLSYVQNFTRTQLSFNTFYVSPMATTLKQQNTNHTENHAQPNKFKIDEDEVDFSKLIQKFHFSPPFLKTGFYGKENIQYRY